MMILHMLTPETLADLVSGESDYRGPGQNPRREPARDARLYEPRGQRTAGREAGASRRRYA